MASIGTSPRSRRMNTIARRMAVAVGAVVGLAAAADAQPSPSDPFIRIHATAPGLSGWYNVPLAQASILPDGYSWNILVEGGGPTDIMDGGVVVGHINQLSTSVRTLAGGLQALSLSFVITAGSSDTVFDFSSTLMSFAGINPAEGRANANVGCTDNNGNGATMTYLQPGGSAYMADTNGGTLFTYLVGGGSLVAGPGLSNNQTQNMAGFVGIPGTVSSSHADFNFSLTAADSASGSSTFFVRPVPAPAAAVPLLGLALAGRRRRR